MDQSPVADSNFKSDPPNALICVIGGEEAEEMTVSWPYLGGIVGRSATSTAKQTTRRAVIR